MMVDERLGIGSSAVLFSIGRDRLSSADWRSVNAVNVDIG